jgi:hypothetical protein
MKVGLEIDSRKTDVSQIPQKVSPILDSVKQRGLNVKEFEIEVDVSGTNISQVPQKVSTILDSVMEQGLCL